MEDTNALDRLESLSYPEDLQEKPSLFRPEVVIPVCLVSMLVIGIVLVLKRMRRR